MNNTAERIAQATVNGARVALYDIADIIAGMHAIEERRAGSVLPIGPEYDLHTARAKVLAELAREIERVCRDCKLEVPPTLRKVK